MIHDNELMEKYLVEEGGYALLDKLGLHNYEDELNKESFMAVVFTDSEILKHVWLLDTPGDLNNDDGDDIEKALSSVELVDGVIFVSTHTGFLKDTDLGIHLILFVINHHLTLKNLLSIYYLYSHIAILSLSQKT